MGVIVDLEKARRERMRRIRIGIQPAEAVEMDVDVSAVEGRVELRYGRLVGKFKPNEARVLSDWLSECADEAEA